MDLLLGLECLPGKAENSKHPRHVEAPLVVKASLQVTLCPTPHLASINYQIKHGNLSLQSSINLNQKVTLIVILFYAAPHLR